MDSTQTIIFQYNHGDHGLVKEEIKLNINATDDEVRRIYTDWVKRLQHEWKQGFKLTEEALCSEKYNGRADIGATECKR